MAWEDEAVTEDTYRVTKEEIKATLQSQPSQATLLHFCVLWHLGSTANPHTAEAEQTWYQPILSDYTKSDQLRDPTTSPEMPQLSGPTHPPPIKTQVLWLLEYNPAGPRLLTNTGAHKDP